MKELPLRVAVIGAGAAGLIAAAEAARRGASVLLMEKNIEDRCQDPDVGWHAVQFDAPCRCEGHCKRIWPRETISPA